MYLAGPWKSWKAPDGRELETFAIRTTAANKLVEPIHNCMPAILNSNAYHLWVNRNMLNPDHLHQLYLPFPIAEMTAHKVPDLVNNPRFDSPACIAQV